MNVDRDATPAQPSELSLNLSEAGVAPVQSIEADAEVLGDQPANPRLEEIVHCHLIMLCVSGTGRTPGEAARVVS